MPHRDKSLSSERQPLVEVLRSSRWARGLTAPQLRRRGDRRRRVALSDRGLCLPQGRPGGFLARRGFGFGENSRTFRQPGKSVSFEGVTAGGWFARDNWLKSEHAKYDALALRDSRIASMPAPTFAWLGRTAFRQPLPAGTNAGRHPLETDRLAGCRNVREFHQTRNHAGPGIHRVAPAANIGPDRKVQLDDVGLHAPQLRARSGREPSGTSAALRHGWSLG